VPLPLPCCAQFAGKDTPSTVISFAQKTLKDGAVVSKLHVIELGGAGAPRVSRVAAGGRRQAAAGAEAVLLST
jgi:hypothetical protein